ncbi:MAG: 50S ribosomal protein L6 [Deltaproteobacteria bacterium]|nr:50S ribosomal protein L6 [Deltaproteobacteria bacterium]
MSRIGRMTIKVPDKVKVTAQPGLVNVEGPKGKISQKLDASIKIVIEKGEIHVQRPDDTTKSKSLHGLSRTLINNMVLGVTTGFERSLEITGVGYKAELKGKEIHLALGFSHPVVYPLPEGVTAEYDAKANKLTVKGADKHKIGLIAAEIRKLRPPEPYKGKGIKYAEETIRRKQGKTGAA